LGGSEEASRVDDAGVFRTSGAHKHTFQLGGSEEASRVDDVGVIRTSGTHKHTFQ